MEQPASKLDPELVEELKSGGTVQAVFRLRSPDPCRTAPSPEQTELTAFEIVGRVERSLGVGPTAVNVLRNLGYVVIDAVPAFVRRLSEQDEVLSVKANRRRAR